MIMPMLPAWIEEGLDLPSLRIECRYITAFKTITLSTGVCKVVSLGGTTVLFGDNVIDFVDEHGIVSMN